MPTAIVLPVFENQSMIQKISVLSLCADWLILQGYQVVWLVDGGSIIINIQTL